MKPIAWTVLATQIPPGGALGGIVRYTSELIRALSQRDDVLVSAIATQAARDTVGDLVGDRARVSTVPSVGAPLLSITERYAPLASLRHGPDVVHGVKHLVPRRTNALRVLTVHDMLLLDRPDDFGLPKRLLLPAAYRASIRNADLLLCVSEATRARVVSLVPGSLPRTEVVHLATSDSLLSARPQEIAVLSGRQFALVVGDASPRKNLATIVQAWPRVRETFPDAVLAVVGPPNWSRTDVGELFDSLVDSGAILALGHVSEEQLRWAYDNAAIALAPSLAEGFGLPAAEALDLGTPIIVSDDAALVEVSAGRAFAVLPASDVDRWSETITAAFLRYGEHRTNNVGEARIGRTWAEVAQDSVRAVQQALESREVSQRSS